MTRHVKTKITTLFVTPIIVALLVWACAAFILWDIDLSQMTEDVRGGLVFTWALLSILIVGVTAAMFNF